MLDPTGQGMIPAITFANCEGPIDFYVEAFGAEEMFRFQPEGGPVVHAQLQVGGTIFFLGLANPELDCKTVEETGVSPIGFYCYVLDADAAVAKAIAAGAEELLPVQDMFWGDRVGTVTDPYGIRWTFATHLRTVTPEELAAGAEG